MSPVPSAPTNADVDWDSFDSESYFRSNYETLSANDRQIVEMIGAYFSGTGVDGGRAIDVGAGTNLYPSFAMLPLAQSIDLLDLSAANVDWLSRQVRDFDRNWDEVWNVYRGYDAYAQVTDPRALLGRIGSVRRANVFELPTAAWNLGTMFFVACSISTHLAEFQQAVHCFVRALVPGAPFATAFMTNSHGYVVGHEWSPAVAVGPTEVTACLSTVAYDVRVTRIDRGTPLRPGVGMILATGHSKG